MSEFCEQCPLRGTCIGPIQDIEAMTIQHQDLTGFRVRKWTTTLIECYDDFGNPSETFANIDPETIVDSIDGCSEPELVVKERLFLKPISYSLCGGLGIRPNADYEDKELF